MLVCVSGTLFFLLLKQFDRFCSDILVTETFRSFVSQLH